MAANFAKRPIRLLYFLWCSLALITSCNEKVLNPPAPSRALQGISEGGIYFQPKAGSEKSLGQRVLVVDHGGRFAGFVRYKYRVLDFLEPDDQGHYHTTAESIFLPQWMNHLLSEKYRSLSAREVQKKLSPALLRDFAQYPDFREVDLQGDWSGNHGTSVLSILAEHNPNAEFVFAQLPAFEELAKPLCKKGALPKEVFKNAQIYYQTITASLKEVVLKHQINFINFSFVLLGDVVDDYLKTNCPALKRNPTYARQLSFLAYQYFTRPMSEIPDVIVAQGLPNNPIHVNTEDNRHIGIWGKLQNGLRVGSFSVANANVPQEGSNNFELLPQHQRPYREVGDLFINAGIDCQWMYESQKSDLVIGENPVQLSLNGLDRRVPAVQNYCFWFNSYATPITISYLIYLKNHLPKPVDIEALLWHANQGGKGKLKDPAFHHELEVDE